MRDPRLAAFRRASFTRRGGWWLAATLALLSVLFGAQRLGWAGLTQAVLALTRATRSLFGAGWLLLLLAAAGLTLGLILSSPRGRTSVRWLRSREGRWLVRLFVAVSLLTVLVLNIVVLPPRFTAHRDFKTISEELKAQNDIRTTLLQALAGTVLAIGAYLTFRQLLITREGQITDRYTKAVDQLGSEHISVRLGGIYALGRIARDSSDDRITISDVLSAYIRGHAPWPPRLEGQPPANTPTKEVPELQVRAPDVQAALTVRGHGPFPAPWELRSQRTEMSSPRDIWVTPGVVGRLNLTSTDLRRAALDGADLRGANLFGADLRGANLFGADLQVALLSNANLRDARLFRIDLRDAVLSGANLQDAWLNGADLRDARLDRVNLQGANLQDAQLDGASLQDANLIRANLGGADLDGVNLRGAQANNDTCWPERWTRESAIALGVKYDHLA
jgi:hypothetical protein